MSRPFCVADDQNFVAVKAGHAADDGGVVAKAAVAVNFAEVGEHALDVVERLRPLRMPRQFGFLPGGGGRIHLFAEECRCVPAVSRSRGGSRHLRRQRDLAVAATWRSICFKLSAPVRAFLSVRAMLQRI